MNKLNLHIDYERLDVNTQILIMSRIIPFIKEDIDFITSEKIEIPMVLFPNDLLN